jgi:hypothetical protein
LVNIQCKGKNKTILFFGLTKFFSLSLSKFKIMTEEEFENWQMVQYRMDNEGIDYCFEHYSSFEEIKDEEFHKLRLEFLENMKKIRKYVEDKIDSYEEEY